MRQISETRPVGFCALVSGVRNGGRRTGHQWFRSLCGSCLWAVRLNGTVYCHKPMRKSYSEVGLRRGRRAPSAMACGRSKAYRPRKLMFLKSSGETLAMSASLMSQPSRVELVDSGLDVGRVPQGDGVEREAESAKLF